MTRFELVDPLAWKVVSIAASSASGAVSIATLDVSVAMFGVPLSVLFAGLSGSVIALAFLNPMSRPKMGVAVIAGLGVAAYGTRIVAHVLGWGDASLHPGIAFGLGLGSHVALTFAFLHGPRWLAKRTGVEP